MDNYEVKYNAALSRAKKELQACGSQDCDAARQIFRLFPELKESEGERIKKEIIRILKGETGYTSKEDTDKYIAWLEKQGEKLDADNVIAWLECDAFQSWGEPIDIRPIIRKFKKDFGL